VISALNVDKIRLDMGDYVLSVQGLHARIGRRAILGGVDLDVRRRSITALVGPAGAGKSAVLACIAGALKPTRGRIRYFGYEVRGRSEVRLVRIGIARAPQAADLFAGLTALETATVGALLRRPRPARARAHAREMLALVGLGAAESARVETIDEVARRRLAVALALATDPQLLLLDDPWRGLGERERAEFVGLVNAARERGPTVVVATRTLDELAARVDSVITIDRGMTDRMETYAAPDLFA
jgi:branched-chain amino acid transport system ATP-binding protein